MEQRPLVIFSDIHLEGRIPQYMEDLLARCEVRAPNRNSAEKIDAARSEADYWITRVQPLNAQQIQGMSRLRLVSAWGVGYNHIDTAAATARGIPVCINPVFTRSVSEAALTLMLALSKRLPQFMRDANSGRRSLESERGVELSGKTLALVGLGRIGEDLGALSHCLGMTVIAHDPYRPAETFPSWAQPVTFYTALQNGDFVVAIAALTPETYHLFGAAQFARMKPDAYFINVGRGALIDEAALYKVLKAGRLAGAGLDVWEREPLVPDHPLLSLDNVIGTPHKLASTWDSLRAICEAIQANVFRTLAGERPQHVVNPEIYGRP